VRVWFLEPRLVVRPLTGGDAFNAVAEFFHFLQQMLMLTPPRQIPRLGLYRGEFDHFAAPIKNQSTL
jgi:hypothetical protein